MWEDKEEIDERFVHLLKPIKDLTKNWEIDIAAELAEYMNILENLTISVEGYAAMNFVQAAYLIQGSTSVYSKKVELLYKWVMETLDLLTSKGKKRDTAGNATDNSTDDEKKDDEEFQSLDDLPENRTTDEKTAGDRRHSILFTPKTPNSLFPKDEVDKGDITLLSRKGDILGNKKDFRLNLSSIYESGVLVLDMSMLHKDFAPEKKDEAKQNDTEEQEADTNGLMNNEVDDASFGGDPLPDNDDVEMAADIGEDVERKPEEGAAGDPPIDGAAKRPERKVKIAKPVDIKKEEDPWLCLEDPHKEFKENKPLKIGKPYRLPVNLRPGYKCEDKLCSIASYIRENCYSHRKKFSKKNRNVPTFQEFDGLYIAYKKEQKETRRRKSLAEQGRYDDDMQDDESDGDGDQDGGPGDDGLPVGDDDVDDGAVQDQQMVFEPQQDVFDMDPFDALRLSAPSRAVRSVTPDLDTPYEELVRAHVERYLAGAQQFLQVTELARRVTEWEARILPKLEEEESHEPFDIHTYGSKVLACFADNNRKQTLAFTAIGAGKPDYEVARLFLASLQLANTYNVEIEKHGVGEIAVDTMELTLLSRRRHHEDLETFQAPSLQ